MYEIQQKMITSWFSGEFLESLKTHDVVLAGGAVLSVFTRKPINDFDLYFKSEESLESFCLNLMGSDTKIGEDWVEGLDWEAIYQGHTDKSILFGKDDLKCQLIRCHYPQTVQELFETFDYTVCMGAYSFKEEKFTLHENFLEDIAANHLVFNTKTTYPIVSAIRVHKYKEKGFDISLKEMYKILAAVSNMRLESWDQVKAQFGGMYGLRVGDIFDTSQEVTFENILQGLEKVNQFSINFLAYSDPLSLFKELNEKRIKGTKYYYKAVAKKAGGLQSYYRGSFKYPLGDIIQGVGEGIYCCYTKDLAADFHIFKDMEKTPIIELEVFDETEIIVDRGIYGEIKLKGPVKVVRIIDPEELEHNRVCLQGTKVIDIRLS